MSARCDARSLAARCGRAVPLTLGALLVAGCFDEPKLEDRWTRLDVVGSNVAQALTTRLGARSVLSAGLLLTAAGGVLYAQMPADGHYFWSVFPGLIVSGIGLALSFVPVTIASLTGVQSADAGVASGLINTSRQIGGSVGLAAVTAIAATATSHYADSHAVLAVSGPALTHGFQVAFYGLAGVALVGAAIVAAFVESEERVASPAQQVESEVALGKAA